MQLNIKQKLCLFTSDIHGNISQYEKILKIVKKKHISYVFLGGDLFPKEGGLWHLNNTERTIQSQKTFIKNYFNHFLLSLSHVANVYLIFGNDDFASCEKTITQKLKKIHVINNKYIKINKDINIYGYPYVQLTPFLNKDWEKWDNLQTTISPNIKINGYWSKCNKHIPVDYLKIKNKFYSIEDDLKKIKPKIDIKKTIFLFHQPPYGGNLDVIKKTNRWFNKDRHVGSKSIQHFINQEKPLLTLHGHIHETVSISKNFIDHNQNYLSFTAGNNYLSQNVSFLIFDLHNFSDVKRLSI